MINIWRYISGVYRSFRPSRPIPKTHVTTTTTPAAIDAHLTNSYTKMVLSQSHQHLQILCALTRCPRRRDFQVISVICLDRIQYLYVFCFLERIRSTKTWKTYTVRRTVTCCRLTRNHRLNRLRFRVATEVRRSSISTHGFSIVNSTRCIIIVLWQVNNHSRSRSNSSSSWSSMIIRSIRCLCESTMSYPIIRIRIRIKLRIR